MPLEADLMAAGMDESAVIRADITLRQLAPAHSGSGQSIVSRLSFGAAVEDMVIVPPRKGEGQTDRLHLALAQRRGRVEYTYRAAPLCPV